MPQVHLLFGVSFAVQYFDLQGSEAHFTLKANEQSEATWSADVTPLSESLHGNSSTRHIVPDVNLKSGDVIRVEC
jgi:hypothetical protein